MSSPNLHPASVGNAALPFLNFGCGPGRVDRELAQSGYGVTRIDRSRSLVRIAKKLGATEDPLNFRLSATEQLSSAGASFDFT